MKHICHQPIPYHKHFLQNNLLQYNEILHHQHIFHHLTNDIMLQISNQNSIHIYNCFMLKYQHMFLLCMLKMLFHNNKLQDYYYTIHNYNFLLHMNQNLHILFLSTRKKYYNQFIQFLMNMMEQVYLYIFQHHLLCNLLSYNYNYNPQLVLDLNIL